VFEDISAIYSGALRPAITATVHGERPSREITQAQLDAVLADSFPASDPPSWTAGIARPAPERESSADAN
jgi:hypothetical protein